VDGVRGNSKRPCRIERAVAASKQRDQGCKERAGPGDEQVAQAAAAASRRQSKRHADRSQQPATIKITSIEERVCSSFQVPENVKKN